jgi:hypothetical protein
VPRHQITVAGDGVVLLALFDPAAAGKGRNQMPDIVLTSAQAIKASEMFFLGIRSDFGMDDDGNVPLSKAMDVLRKAFESVQFVEEHGGDEPV